MRRLVPTVALAAAIFGISVASADAAIVFDGSPGIGSPPATLGGYAIIPFGLDPQPLSTDVSSVMGPGGSISFSVPRLHCRIGGCWATWSQAYGGDVYAIKIDGSPLTMTVPAGTHAFRFYVEPEVRGLFTITATSADGTTSGPVLVDGDGGAQYFGFYGTAGDTVAAITVSSETGSLGFAVGEFGIAPETDVPGLSSSVSANGGAGPVSVGGTDYYRGQVLVGLHAADVGSGIAKVTCTIDGSQVRTFVPGSDGVPGSVGTSDLQFSFDFNTPGTRSYSCTATDVAGNTSAATAGSFVIDDAAPVTTATTTPSGGVGSSSVTVDLNATDPAPGVGVDHISVSVDGGPFADVAGASASRTFTTAGAHTVQYRATDRLGNVESTKSITVYVDATRPRAPVVDAFYVPVGSVYPGVLSGTAHDNLGVASVQVRLDDAIGTITYSHPFTADCTGCGSPGTKNVAWSVDFSGKLPTKGNYIATITVTDLAGNTRTLRDAAIVVQT